MLEAKDNEGNSFLHKSVKENNLDLVEYIAYKNVNVNMKNNDGDTPLHLAMKNITNQEVK